MALKDCNLATFSTKLAQTPDRKVAKWKSHLSLFTLSVQSGTQQMVKSSWLRSGSMYTITNIMVRHKVLIKDSVDSVKPCCQLKASSISLRFRGWGDTVKLSSVLVTCLTLSSSLSGEETSERPHWGWTRQILLLVPSDYWSWQQAGFIWKHYCMTQAFFSSLELKDDVVGFSELFSTWAMDVSANIMTERVKSDSLYHANWNHDGWWKAERTWMQ